MKSICLFAGRHAGSLVTAGLVLALVAFAGWLDPQLAPVAGFGGMLANKSNLDKIFTGFKTAFQGGISEAQAASQHAAIATTVTSTTSKEEYPWLGMLPNMREWIGDRVVHGMQAHKYTIVNKDYEHTIGMDKNQVLDDTFGILAPAMRMQGQAVAAHPDQLVWPLLAAGFTTDCYDGQYFFDTDHPVLDANGSPQSVANTDGGSGTAWFLIDTKKPLRPIILQERQAPQLVAMDQDTDEQVFRARQYRYGVHARRNVGYGFWQVAWGSKQALNKTYYEAARVGLMGMKGDYGRPLGLMPDTLIVPPALEREALELINAERDSNGATNVYRGTAKIVVVPWLA